MFAPRSVTLTPLGWPSRNLKFAMLLLAFVTTGCYPVIVAISFTTSRTHSLGISLRIPELTTIFSRLGTTWGLVIPSDFLSSGTTFSRYIFLSAGVLIVFYILVSAYALDFFES